MRPVVSSFYVSIVACCILHLKGNGKCSQAAQITAQAASLRLRSSTWIVAEEIVSQRQLRCEVFVDDIQNIEILTTTRIIYREDKEVLEIQVCSLPSSFLCLVC